MTQPKFPFLLLRGPFKNKGLRYKVFFLLFCFSAFLLLTVISSSCNPEVPEEPDVNVVELRQHYPIDIPFEEYDIRGTYCNWYYPPYDDKVIIINSKEELEKYVSCKGSMYTDIDFSKHTLLYLSGKNQLGSHESFVKKIVQTSKAKYKLHVDVRLNDIEFNDRWIKALLINKIPKDSEVELNLNTIAYYCNLKGKPLELIQATVLGKWKGEYYHYGGEGVGDFIWHTTFEITRDSVFITGDFFLNNGHAPINSFSYTWKEVQMHPGTSNEYTAYVMLINEDYVYGYNGRYRGWLFSRISFGCLLTEIDFGDYFHNTQEEFFSIDRIND